MSGWKPKRFWKDAVAAPAEGGHAVLLDGKPVRTPAKAPLILPSRALARLVAAEWQAQQGELDPATMPATRMANSAIDKVAPMFAEVAALIGDYGGSDLLCYRSEGPAELVRRQAQAWDPLLDWAASRFGPRLNVGQGVMHVEQPAETLAAMRAAVAALSPFELAAFHDLTALTGSLVLAFAALHEARPEAEIWAAARLDEAWQAEIWGVDEEAAEAESIRKADFHFANRFLRLAKLRTEGDS
jgi:chaperone required for assembly of F1-ATPase